MRRHVVHCFILCVIWKKAQMNVLHSLIQELMLNEFELGHHVAEATKKKTICCAKFEGTFDHNTVSRLFMKFRSSCKNLDDNGKAQVGQKPWIPSHTDKSSNTRRVSGKQGISHSSIVPHLYNLGKNTFAELSPMLPK